MGKAEDLASQLRNIGPKMARKMIDAGIETPAELRELGAVRAYERIYAEGDPYGDHNAAYLYALEGAIRDCDWSELPAETKQAFRALAQSMQANRKAT